MPGSRRSGKRSGADDPSHDDVPAEVRDAARAALGRRRSGELAVLSFDSADRAITRPERLLRFDYPSGRIEIVVSTESRACTLRGRCELTGRRAEIEIAGHDVALAEEVRSGAFAFQNVPLGTVRVIVLGSEGAEPVHTDWFRT